MAPVSLKPDFAEKSRFKTAPKTTVKLTDLLKVDSKKDNGTGAASQADADHPFTPEQLQVAWAAFAETRKNLHAEYQLLTQPYDFDGKTVTVHLHHPVQETLLNQLRIEMSTFIRERIRNNSLQITGVLVAQEDNKKVYYTNREKFEYLLEKNPVLKELKDRLGLDTDF